MMWKCSGSGDRRGRLALALLVAAATIAVGAPAASAIDVNAPEAGIADPLAGVAPLDRNCKPGQVDVNTEVCLTQRHRSRS